MPLRKSGVSYADFSGGDANFIIGCTKVSTGCKNCYAEHLISTRFKQDFGHIRISRKKIKNLRRVSFSPKRGQTFVRGKGSRPIIFPVDLGDIFHEDIPFDIIKEAFEIFKVRTGGDWLILTKRPERMALLLPLLFHNRHTEHRIPDHIWCGTTIEHPDYYDRIDELLKINGLRWLSIEPMLAPMSGIPHLSRIDWMIVGAESGENRRKFDKRWALELQELCKVYGTKFYFKQSSGQYPGADPYLNGEMYRDFPV